MEQSAVEVLVIEMESVANMLRVIAFDQRIPKDTKEAIWFRVGRIEESLKSINCDGE